MISKKRLARVAGLLYLILGVCGGFSQLYVRSGVHVPDDAAATAANISASAGLFRLAFASDIVNITCFLLMALTLYALFKQTSHTIALAMVFLNAVAAAIMSVNMLNHLAALQVATGAYPTGLGAEASDSLALLFFDLHAYGYSIATIFFGLFLLPLGYLVFTSGYFPRALGVILMAGCFAYLTELVVRYISPDIAPSISAIIATPAGIAEMSFALWLLVKGADVRAHDEQLAVTA